MNSSRLYVAIDLKSFYASVECVERGLDPMKTNLVVADRTRTEKTICLAVSPSLKQYGISGRARLFEVIQQVSKANKERLKKAPGRYFLGSSFLDDELMKNPALSIDYLTAPPRMAFYMEYSARIYRCYLKFLAPEDIHIYSIDEIMCDVTSYLDVYRMTARELTEKMIQTVYEETGITATAGIGTNLYLCKVAMDIVAKHTDPDEHGVRIAELDELSYRRLLWEHRPLTDFWRVGKGYARKLEENGLFTMGDIARCSIGRENSYYNEELLYRLFGINAELLIDHAWGWEPCTIAEIKNYRPESSSIGSGQVLSSPYSFQKARLVVQEMADSLALELVDKQLVTRHLTLTVGYDRENLDDSRIRGQYQGEIVIDRYGRKLPKHAHGVANLERETSSSKALTSAVLLLYDRIVNPKLLVRRLNLTADQVIQESQIKESAYEQLSLFVDYEALEKKREQEKECLEKEKRMQQAVLDIKKKYGKNAILKGMNLKEGATAIERNQKIGGHQA